MIEKRATSRDRESTHREAGAVHIARRNAVEAKDIAKELIYAIRFALLLT